MSCSYFYDNKMRIRSSSVFRGSLYLKTWGEFIQIEKLTLCQMDDIIKGQIFSVSVQYLLGRHRALFRETLIAPNFGLLLQCKYLITFQKRMWQKF